MFGEKRSANRQRQSAEDWRCVRRGGDRRGGGRFALAAGEQGHETEMRRSRIGMQMLVPDGSGA